jgi:hypothetical protein
MNAKRITSSFAHKLLGDLANPNSKQAQMVKDLIEFYRQIGGNAMQVFESKLKEFMQDPDAHLGLVDEVTFADLLKSHRIPHRFVPETGYPTPDIGATILSRDIYFEIKAVQEDRYMSFIDEVLKQIGEMPSQHQIIVIPVYIGQVDRASLVARVVQAIQNRLAAGDFSPIQYEDKDVSIYVRFEAGSHPSPYFWRFTWPESRMICGIPFLQYKLEKTLKKNIEQFKSHRPTFLVWYMWDQSLWDAETQSGFLAAIPRILKQRDFVNVAGIIVAAPSWSVFENELYQDFRGLKSIGLFNAIRALQ